MKISFIGAGKVGISLGIYLKKNNFNVIGYYSKTRASAQHAGNLTSSGFFTHLEEVLQGDIIFIAVGDDAINQVAQDIIKLNINYKNKIFVHMSGALPSSQLNLLKKLGSYVVSLHPIQAFAHIKESVNQLTRTVFSMEGDPEGILTLKGILDRCGNSYFVLKEGDKALYHASACILSNYLVSLLDYGFSVLEHIGFPQELAIKSFFPLIEASINSVRKLGPQDALTGPINRGDFNTIKKHLESFRDKKIINTKIYKILGQYTLQLAQENTGRNNKFDFKILELLEDDYND